MEKLTPVDALRAGDVLLCFTNRQDKISKAIRAASGNPYTHAAICIGDGLIADATLHGVRIRSLKELLSEFDHLAVFRSPDAWGPDRVRTLQSFVTDLNDQGTAYNYHGVLRFRRDKNWHESNQLDLVRQYFEQPEAQSPTKFFEVPYFCSELVAACFVRTGFIDESAAIVLRPSTFASGDLSQESAFGYLLGYLANTDDYVVPANDAFMSYPRYRTIFESD